MADRVLAARFDDPERAKKHCAAYAAIPDATRERLHRRIMEAWTGDAHSKGHALNNLAHMAVQSLADYIDASRDPHVPEPFPCPLCEKGSGGGVHDLCGEHREQFDTWVEQDANAPALRVLSGEYNHPGGER